MSLKDIEAAIRDIPDFPKAGIIFKDITPILQDPGLFRESIELMTAPWREAEIDLIVGIESRGFIFGSVMAYTMGLGFVPARKGGKLPWQTHQANYELEYGTATVEMHTDAVNAGQRILIVDDLLATGGTAKATAELVERTGGESLGIQVLIELSFLKPREKLKNQSVNSLITVE